MSTILKLSLPILAAVVVTLFVNARGIDLELSRRFFNGSTQSWAGKSPGLWMWLYNYGPLPGILLGVWGGIEATYGLIRRQESTRTRFGVFLLAGLILGPGLVVNGILKQNVGRPRPRETLELGGTHAFVPVGKLGDIASNSSFTCGHASMGFYLMLPGFYFLKKRQSRLAAIWFCGGVLYGGLIGVARITQGGHYLTDVLWSGVIVYVLGVLLSPILGDAQTSEGSLPLKT